MKTSFKTQCIALLLIIVAFIVLFLSVTIPPFETIFGIASTIFCITVLIYVTANARKNNTSVQKSLILKLIFCIVIFVCMIFNLFSTHTDLVAEHLLELYTY